jgi:hypothetical protein
MSPPPTRDMLSKSPTAASDTSTDDPPYEMNGSGMPFAGSSETTTLILNRACTMIPVISPIPSSIPNLSGALTAALAPRHNSSAKSITTLSVPISPNSSPTTEKIKSECGYGQIKQLLLPLCKPLAYDPSRPDRI